MDTTEYTGIRCPKCGSEPVLRKNCHELHCENGYIDEYDNDPINFAMGEIEYPCPECEGSGQIVWCRSCGHQIRPWEIKNET